MKKGAKTMNALQKIYALRISLGIMAAFLGLGYLIAAGSISRNLILNPSVEVGEIGTTKPNYWFPSENGTEWSTAYARTGSRSLRINVNNASAEWKSNAAIIDEGNTYQIQGFFGGQVKAAQFLLVGRWFSDSQGVNFIKEDIITIPVGNYTQWLSLGLALTAPSGAKSCRILFRAVNGSGDLYGDDFEVRQTESLTKLLNSLSIAVIVYLISYYVIKRIFILKVEKPQKLFTMGIGIYFIAWLVCWVLLYTIFVVA